jgi:hypothetical protein
MKGAECEYMKRRGFWFVCTIDQDKKTELVECKPLANACDRAVLKEKYRGIPLYKTESLA